MVKLCTNLLEERRPCRDQTTVWEPLKTSFGTADYYGDFLLTLFGAVKVCASVLVQRRPFGDQTPAKDPYTSHPLGGLSIMEAFC
jgi:hypothetical protein